jgi:predicted nucleic acid-binding Zn ribbon protein
MNVAVAWRWDEAVGNNPLEQVAEHTESNIEQRKTSVIVQQR